jgi:thymidine kinase
MSKLLNSYNPGVLEAITGPMKCGKTNAFIFRIEKLDYRLNIPYQAFRPDVLVREFEDPYMISVREGKDGTPGRSIPAIPIGINSPEDIINHELLSKTKVVGIDEAQFFNESLVGVVRDLLMRDINIIVSGLDTDFRRNPFGVMANLICMADDVSKHYACCEQVGCGDDARWTQRLIDGNPAPYDDDLVIIGDKKAEGKRSYQARCTKHYEMIR